MIRYLTTYEVLALHQMLLDDFGGMRGITEAGFARLEAALGAPQQSFFGEDLYPDLPAKAAALVNALASAHPFSDGNKRVAVAALDLFVRFNRGELLADNQTLYDLAMATANGLERPATETWLRQLIREAA